MPPRWTAAILLSTLAASPTPDPASAVRARIALIESGRARPGAVFTFTAAELNAYARRETPTIVPDGLRQPRLELRSGAATAYALIDFLKLRHAQGANTPWLLSKLIEGERPIKVEARIDSAHGKAIVHLDRVEISGVAVTGSPLDFLIQTFFLPLYPKAHINQPFALADRIDRIEVNPTAARVFMRP